MCRAREDGRRARAAHRELPWATAAARGGCYRLECLGASTQRARPPEFDFAAVQPAERRVTCRPSSPPTRLERAWDAGLAAGGGRRVALQAAVRSRAGQARMRRVSPTSTTPLVPYPHRDLPPPGPSLLGGSQPARYSTRVVLCCRRRARGRSRKISFLYAAVTAAVHAPPLHATRRRCDQYICTPLPQVARRPIPPQLLLST